MLAVIGGGRLTAEAKYKLGWTFKEEDDCEKALAVLETIPQEHPDYADLADVYIATGECYVELNKLDDAKRVFSLLHNKFPEQRELALKKINEVVAAQKAQQKANEAAATSAEESAEEKTD